MANKLENLFKEGKESSLMTSSVSLVKTSRTWLGQIKEKEKYARLFLRAKNNLALCLAFSLWPSPEDIADADKFSKENYDLAQNNMQGERPKYIYEATRALVLLRFSKDRREAEEIYKNLLSEVNRDGISVFDIPRWAREEITENKKFIERILELRERYPKIKNRHQ